MKFLKVLLFSLSFAFTAYAADAYKNRNTTEFNKIIKEARESKTDLLILSEAAWCSPCALLNNEVSKDLPIINELKSKLKILKLEETNYDYNLVEIFPFRQSIWPATFFYNSKTDKLFYIRELGTEATVEEIFVTFNKFIEEAKKSNNLLDTYLKRFNAKIAQKYQFTDEDALNHLMNIANTIMLEFNVEYAGKEIDKVLNTVLSNKDLFDTLMTDKYTTWSKIIVSEMLLYKIENNLMTLEEAVQVYPHLKTGPKSNVSTRLEVHVFSKLYAIKRSQGLEKAALQCESFLNEWSNYESTLTANPTEVTKQKILGLAMCKVLSLQTGRISISDLEEWVLSTYKNLPDALIATFDNFFSEYLMSLGLNEFGNSKIDLIIERNVKTFENQITAIKKELETARQKGDVVEIEGLQVELNNLQIHYDFKLNALKEKKHFWSNNQKAPVFKFIN